VKRARHNARVLTVPNLLSGFRLLLVPVLLLLAWTGLPKLFFTAFVISLVTDCLDGYFARRLNQMTRLGTKLDSWADMATWLALPLCAWWLRPDALRQEAVWLAAGIGCYVMSVLVGFLKYRRLIGYHTWGAKALAWLMGGAALVLFAGGPGWVLRLAMPVVIVSAMEEIAMTLVLPDWRANVPSLWHALKLRKFEAAKK
jgi:CDP-diacylglycerol--glycerol-3-phosphate 3-phosphatidyltransferase